jgi:hypothetical protein
MGSTWGFRESVLIVPRLDGLKDKPLSLRELEV